MLFVTQITAKLLKHHKRGKGLKHFQKRSFKQNCQKFWKFWS